jgi:SAM-dependent methyltransferase
MTPNAKASDGDAAFTDAVSRIYERFLVPLIFEDYAAGLARRLASVAASRVLEVAAGTGVVTRAVASTLPASVEIVATDLNQTMLDQAAAAGTSRPVEWRQANAMALPFEDASFDAVVCQFGVMFFPDQPKAFAEARRVLRTGGVFLFNVWDRIEENEFADVVTRSLEPLFPDDPPRFLARTPHGYFDPARIVHDLAAGGFTTAPDITTIAERSRAASPDIPAIAYCHGTVLRNEIEARDPSGLERATDVATAAIAARFGSGAVDGKIQAHVVMVSK